MTTTISYKTPPAVKSGEGIKVVRTCTIRRSAEELYHFWRCFENLPKVMPQLVSVTRTSSRISHWVAHGPVGEVEWDAEIINETVGRMIAWKTLEGETPAHAGTVRFEPVDGNTATEVTVSLEYHPPGGKVTDIIAKLIGKDPGKEISDALERLKKLVEL